MDNSDEKSTRVVRQYRKSSLPRLRWTPQLHHHFVEAVLSLGGKHATPKKIMQSMGVKGLKISQIKSHLQMYRNMRESTVSNEFMTTKSYEGKRPNPGQGLREASFHEKSVRLELTSAVTRSPDAIYHEYQGTEGSSTSEITKGSPGANMEVQGTSEINFLGLDISSINLDLSISSE